MQSLKRIDPESHAFAWRRGSDGAELVKKDLAAATMAPPHLVAKGEKVPPWLRAWASQFHKMCGLDKQ